MVELTIIYHEVGCFGVVDDEETIIKTIKSKDHVSCLRKILVDVLGCDEDDDVESLNEKDLYESIMSAEGVVVAEIFEGKPKVYKPRKR